MKKMTDAELTEKLENGELCAICNEELIEDYGWPIACEDCGGDALKTGIDEQ